MNMLAISIFVVSFLQHAMADTRNCQTLNPAPELESLVKTYPNPPAFLADAFKELELGWVTRCVLKANKAKSNLTNGPADRVFLSTFACLALTRQIKELNKEWVAEVFNIAEYKETCEVTNEKTLQKSLVHIFEAVGEADLKWEEKFQLLVDSKNPYRLSNKERSPIFWIDSKWFRLLE